MEQIYPGLTSAVHEIPLRPEYIGSKSEEDGFPTALGDDARHR